MTPGPTDADTVLAGWSLATSVVAVALSLAFGVPALIYGFRADKRAKRADERAEASDVLAREADARARVAEDRANRMDARAVELHDVDWHYELRDDDQSWMDVTNIGRDTAHQVLVVAEIDGTRVTEELDVVARNGGSVALHLPFIKRALDNSEQVLAVQGGVPWMSERRIEIFIRMRVLWRTALDSPREISNSAIWRIDAT